MYTQSLLAAFLSLSLTLSAKSAPEYIWQQTHAKTLPTGDLQYSPQPLEGFEPADYHGEVRYIDYENGKDANDGMSPQSPWKHHPWDWAAAGKAKAHSGITAYVFKRGVYYRGQLRADESGEPGNSIILTSISSWGEGSAIIAGSERLPANWVAASSVDHPERLAEPEKVWALDLAEAGLRPAKQWYTVAHITEDTPDSRHFRELNLPWIGLWKIEPDGEATQLHIASSPDWQPGNNTFVLEYWHAFDGQKTLKDPETGKTANAGYDEFLVGKTAEELAGGYMWLQYPSFMGTPIPSEIPEQGTFRGLKGPIVDPEDGTFLKGTLGGVGANVRYMLEHLPQFLDAPGEFYLDTGRQTLFYRPEDGVDPNNQHLEIATDQTKLILTNHSHIEVAGLRFAFADAAAIDLSAHKEETTTHINIHHCRFDHLMRFGINGNQNGNVRYGYVGNYTDQIRIADCQFQDIWETAIKFEAPPNGESRIGHIEVLRNSTYNTGMRHQDVLQSNVPAMEMHHWDTGVIAGNFVKRSFGAGIFYQGTRSATDLPKDRPLVRILIFQNRAEDTCLGCNDWGGIEANQSGPTYVFNNVSGNCVGHMPGGWGGKAKPEQVRKMNIGYPFYLDGSYKHYFFNNIGWGRSTDPDDPYRSGPVFQAVFGFMNEMSNNTFYNGKIGISGSTGGRQNVQSNLFAEIGERFFHQAHGTFSQIGGGDDNTISAVGSLGFAHNIFHGPAHPGGIASMRRGAESDVGAETIAATQEQLANYGKNGRGIRVPLLGQRAEELPIVSGAKGPIITGLREDNIDFRPAEGSAAIDSGGTLFVPWALAATVGEWHFNKNVRDPTEILEYSWYISTAQVERKMHANIPTFIININQAEESDYIPSPSEDWIDGALRFDGQSRFGKVSDEQIKADILAPVPELNSIALRNMQAETTLWAVDEPSGTDEKGEPAYTENDFARFPGKERKTPDITTQNVLVEVSLLVDKGVSGRAVLGKHDGSRGYSLFINDQGRAVFEIAAGDSTARVTTPNPINDGQWHHILAEADRTDDGCTLRVYQNGKRVAEETGSVNRRMSLSNSADFLVGARFSQDGPRDFLAGALDFARVCQRTLAEAQTSIEELYAWQTDGPAKRDFAGNKPLGRRDSGALERVE